MGYIQLIILFKLIQLRCCQLVIPHKSYESTIDITKTCERNSGARLVEHFFNIIFTEFQSTPSCTCVQMCPGRPFYCYPNDCMKNFYTFTDGTHLHDFHRKSIQTQIENEDSSKHILPVIIEESGENSTDLPYSSDSQQKNSEKGGHTVKNYLGQNIFKDRYNMLIKYKRIPKVELIYNLREQVKTMKSRRLKIDKQTKKWPAQMQSEQINTPVESKSDDTVAKPVFLP